MNYCTIVDKLTASCIGGIPILPRVGFLQLFFFRPNILFVESAWQGWHSSWKYKVADYPDHPGRNNHSLLRLLEYAHKRHIVTVFWDKEGLVHFNRFINSARHFDHIFTVDAATIHMYKAVMGENASVHLLPFAVQPKFHYFNGFHFEKNTACFLGSYSRHIHPERRRWQQMFFEATLETGLGVTVFDRNSSRHSSNYRYPQVPGMEIFPAVSYEKTADIYRRYLISLNVNTNENSSTMVSRRLIEILACGGIAVTNPTPAVAQEFSEFCHVIHNKEEATELFIRLKNGASPQDLERARAGAEYIRQHHTWTHRLQQIAEVVGIDAFGINKIL